MDRNRKRKISITVLAISAIALYAAIIVLPLCYAERLGTQFVPAFITAGVAVATGIVALFKDSIWQKINEPHIIIELHPRDKRDCHLTAITLQGSQKKLTDAYYFRLRIVNNGWTTAEEVEVSIEEVRSFFEDDYYVDQRYMPLRLKWSHNDVQPYLAIPPGTFRHCDFGHVLKTNYRLGDIECHAMEDKYYLFWLDVYLRPNAARTAMLPGQFEIVVSAFGKNVQKTSAIIKLDWKGIWCEDSDALYNNCIKIELE